MVHRFLTFVAFALAFAGISPVFSQNLQSLPGSTYVLFLDFDGHTDNSGWWSSTAFPNPVTTGPASLTTAQITEVFNRVSEDFRPFNINVTTFAQVFESAAIDKRQRVVITPNSQFYTDENGAAGGVAYLNTFGGGDIACYVFPNFLGDSPKNIAEASSHEAGHTMGLHHHSKYDAACQYQTEYHPGLGSGQTRWAPIMGNSYSSIISQWYHGASNEPTCNVGIQDDLSIITSQNGFGYRNDDVLNTIAGASLLSFSGNSFSRQGIISTRSDLDVFRLEVPNPGVYTFTATPYSVNTSTLSGANLDIKLTLQNSSGTVLATADDSTVLGSILHNRALNPGTYYLTVDGAGIGQYRDVGGAGSRDYGSLGSYTLSGSFTSNFAANPVISPGTGTYNGTRTVSITSATAGASIYYTLTGNTPVIGTGFTVLYTGPFPVSQTTTIKAMAVATGFQNSGITTAVLTITAPAQVATPVISPGTGTYASPQTVSITCATAGASILYTTNGNVPSATVNSFTRAYTGPFSISANTTIRAIAVRSGMSQSAVAVSFLTLSGGTPVVATPVISPGTGTYTGPQTVSLSTSTSGATLYYTTSGNVPVIGTSFTRLYTGPFVVNSSATIRALAVRSGFTNSAIAVANLTINPLVPVVATPVISPGTGSYTSAQTVTITCGTPGATLYYTTSGNLPQLGTSFTRLYTGPFVVNSTTTVRAMGVATGFTNSAIAAAFLTFGAGAAALPDPEDRLSDLAPILLAFPNPARDRVEIRSSESLAGSEIRLLDVLGREKRRVSPSEGTAVTLPLEGLLKGWYRIQISQPGRESRGITLQVD